MPISDTAATNNAEIVRVEIQQQPRKTSHPTVLIQSRETHMGTSDSTGREAAYASSAAHGANWTTASRKMTHRAAVATASGPKQSVGYCKTDRMRISNRPGKSTTPSLGDKVNVTRSRFAFNRREFIRIRSRFGMRFRSIRIRSNVADSLAVDSSKFTPLVHDRPRPTWHPVRDQSSDSDLWAHETASIHRRNPPTKDDRRPRDCRRQFAFRRTNTAHGTRSLISVRIVRTRSV